jgi:hypothetical protein
MLEAADELERLTAERDVLKYKYETAAKERDILHYLFAKMTREAPL